MTDTVNTITDTTDTAVEAGLREFLEQRTKRSWGPDDDLFASGGVSSLFALELVVHLEQAFGVSVTGDELSLANFRSVRTMTALIGRLAPKPGGADE